MRLGADETRKGGLWETRERTPIRKDSERTCKKLGRDAFIEKNPEKDFSKRPQKDFSKRPGKDFSKRPEKDFSNRPGKDRPRHVEPAPLPGRLSRLERLSMKWRTACSRIHSSYTRHTLSSAGIHSSSAGIHSSSAGIHSSSAPEAGPLKQGAPASRHALVTLNPEAGRPR